MLTKELTEELGSCIFKQFPDEGVYRISRVEEWLATNGYTLEKLGVSDFHELIEAGARPFRHPKVQRGFIRHRETLARLRRIRTPRRQLLRQQEHHT